MSAMGQWLVDSEDGSPARGSPAQCTHVRGLSVDDRTAVHPSGEAPEGYVPGDVVGYDQRLLGQVWPHGCELPHHVVIAVVRVMEEKIDGWKSAEEALKLVPDVALDQRPPILQSGRHQESDGKLGK